MSRKREVLIGAVESALTENKISVDEICEIIKKTSSLFLEETNYVHPISDKELQNTLGALQEFVRESLSHPSTFVMIMMQTELLKGGNLSFRDFVEYLDALTGNGGELQPGSPDQDTNEEYDELDELDEAETKYNNLVDEADDLSDNGHYAEAVEIVDRMIEITRKYPALIVDHSVVMNNRAFYNLMLGNFEEAIADINSVIENDPENELLYHTKSEIMMGMKNFPAALELIDKSIYLKSSEEKLNFRGEILEKMK